MNLFVLSVRQLIRHNIYLGSTLKIWNPLNIDLVFGKRQGYFVYNLTLTIVNLRKSFLLIQLLLRKKLNSIIYIENIYFRAFCLRNFTLINLLNLSVGLGRWIPGFLTNLRSFYILILSRLKRVFSLVRVLKLRKLFFRKLEKFWYFFIFLQNIKKLPSGVFSFDNNAWLISEARTLFIPSMVLSDTNCMEQSLNHSTYVIPFNFLNVKSLLFLFFALNKLFLINLLRRKINFIILLNSLLRLKLFNFKYFEKKGLFGLKFGFSVLFNLIKLNNFKLKEMSVQSIFFSKYLKLNNFKLRHNI